jgi:hypothetical protein
MVGSAANPDHMALETMVQTASTAARRKDGLQR